ncbi:MAG TPA: L-2-hydroxyglutarate oxidase [Thermoleophilaceae bacterium]
MTDVDFAVVGGGILGVAVAAELRRRHPGAQVALLEKEAALARHQTGRNSGVVHAGIYYTPGSLKAKLCVDGARRLYAYCDERGIPFERRGKLIVARDETELAGLDELERRGEANGVPGLRRVDEAGLRAIEPHARGAAALHSPETGVVDFAEVARSLARDFEAAGGRIHLNSGVTGVDARSDPGCIQLEHAQGATRARFAVFAAGHAADTLAVAAGADPDPRIVPFRGAYLGLREDRSHLVRGLIYPVPNPELPFLGVHLSRHIDGRVSLGPSASLAPQRIGHSLVWPGTWRMARRWWRTGIEELRRAASTGRFAREAAAYVPELQPGDFRPWYSGVRAQALGRDGSLVDDFVLSDTARALHVRNAPSPAATSSLAIAGLIADRVETRLD